jgi:hypothetical protein
MEMWVVTCGMSGFRGVVPNAHLGVKYYGSLGILWGSEIFKIVCNFEKSGVIHLEL